MPATMEELASGAGSRPPQVLLIGSMEGRSSVESVSDCTPSGGEKHNHPSTMCKKSANGGQAASRPGPGHSEATLCSAARSASPARCFNMRVKTCPEKQLMAAQSSCSHSEATEFTRLVLGDSLMWAESWILSSSPDCLIPFTWSSRPSHLQPIPSLVPHYLAPSLPLGLGQIVLCVNAKLYSEL
ncbi:hypothetical protein EYF80_011270 [Liparis tanakae]|uniref:Uncharacterized protein n=1 Tax=Liparis tanakae TaxID=230148 RepID=A0A4Z2IL60_9TELE|nr:hypothetical protein EYF80_011270 [Liparis tanakae]